MERRRFVAGVTSFASLAAATTGCLGISDSDSRPAAYTGVLPTRATEGFDRIDTETVRGHPALDVDEYSAPRAFEGVPGVRMEDIRSVVAFGERRATGVATGGFDVPEVSAALVSEGYSENDGGRYRLFENDGVAVALNDRRCIRSALGTDVVRETADVIRGKGTTAADADGDFSALADALGGGTFLTGTLQDIGGPEVARGRSIEVREGSETARVTFVRLYRAAGVAANSTETVNETARKTVRGPVAEADGRAVRVTGEVDVDRL